MSVFENLTKKVTETAKAAAKKSSGLVEVTKLNISIGAEEEKIQKLHADMGKILHENYTNGDEIPEVFKDYCERIEACENAINDMRKKIHELKNTKVCPGCSSELEIDIAFCPKCGMKQEMPVVEEPVQKAEEKTCPSCGAENVSESAFCSKCGTRLE